MEPIYESWQLKRQEKDSTATMGDPFGAIIVRDGVLIANAHNEVLKTNDPTAHAEILANQEGLCAP